MNKQEEIREGIERKIQLGIDFGFSPAEITKEVQEYEDSQGVVLKVERELPVMPPATDEELKARHSGKCQFIRHGEYYNTWFCGLTGETSSTMKFCKKWNGGSCSPEEGITRLEAGYVSVEPLIKEETDGN